MPKMNLFECKRGMTEKWPFFLLTFLLLFGLGITIANLERNQVVAQWSDRRCEIPVIMAASFFRPASDPRTDSDFAKDNFDFCLKSTVEKFISMFMVPIQTLFGKQVNVTGDAINMVDTIRKIATSMYTSFFSYMDRYFTKFNMAVFEMSRITQHLKMAMGRLNGIAVSMIYAGISLFRGIMNFIQAVIRVVLIICGIMLAIIIILWFILFPVIPVILATLGAIVTAVMVFTGILSSELSSDAQGKMGGFCFAEGTMVHVVSREGHIIQKKVEDIQLGDQLADQCGEITALIHMKGSDIPLYNLNGICVSGSHLVMGTDGLWKSVADDERAVKIDRISPIIYCFNTTSNNIPIVSVDGSIILFRDWEELGNTDTKGQFIWNYMVSSMLHSNAKYNDWKHNIRPHCEDALMGPNVLIKTANGFVPMHTIHFGSVLDRHGKSQAVLGCIKESLWNAKQEDGTWHTERYEYQPKNEKDGTWVKSIHSVQPGTETLIGYALITESGEYIIWDDKEQKEKIIRDFTEVGYQDIHKTYEFLEARLRMMNEFDQMRLSTPYSVE